MGFRDHDHPWEPAASFDGGDLNCGNGLLLLIRKHIDPLAEGQLLEILSTEASVREDLPSWCRLTGNELISQVQRGQQTSFLVSKGRRTTDADVRWSSAADPADPLTVSRKAMPATQAIIPVVVPDVLPSPARSPAVAPLSVMGIGSWPRPRWLVGALHDFLSGRLDEAEFQEIADDGVRLAIEAQLRAGVDVVTDGEQRRDDYASFVGGRLDNCQLIPITDLLPYVDHPDEFAAALEHLDVPAEKVRHPAVFGPLGRSRSLAVHELDFARYVTERPVKVALPGPYLLARTMWMECISDRAYENREALADDIVRILREELHFLLAAGAAIVQFDEPVLTEVVYGRPEMGNRSFMCGALGSKGPVEKELEFASNLINRVVDGLPRERLALHVCRGNWTADERAALRGDYRPLVNVLSRANVGTFFLECCTERAGELAVLAQLPDDCRIGVGVINQKLQRIESEEEIIARGEAAIALFGADRVLLNPDCGFATFADNPIASATTAEAKLKTLAAAARILRQRHGVQEA